MLPPAAALAVMAPDRVRFPCVLAMLVVVLTGLGSPLAAQVGQRLNPGDRIRVTYRCDAAAVQDTQPRSGCRRNVGRAAAVGDPLVLASGSQRTEIPYASITLIERSVGQQRHTVRGIGIGLLAGVVLGAIAPCEGGDSQEGVCRAVSVIGLGGLGLITGGVIGWTNRSDQWVPVTENAARKATEPSPAAGRTFSVGLRIPVR